jgi:hypothetical protein
MDKDIQPKRKVPFPKPDKPDKALMPLRCPNQDHDKRTGFPLRFGLSEEKDSLLEKKLLQNLKLSDIDKLVEETCDSDRARLSEPRRSIGHRPHLASVSEEDTQDARQDGRKSAGFRSSRDSTPEQDMSLVTAMASRLRQAEQANVAFKDEIKKKDLLIAQLRADIEKALMAESAKVRDETPRPSDLAMMKEHNAKLRELLRRADADNQIIMQENKDMKKFLKDYGLKWVGEGENVAEDISRKNASEDLLLEGGMWEPSVSQGEPSRSKSDLNSQVGIEALGIPFDPARIMANVQQLNILAEEGSKEVVRGADGIRRLQEKSLVSP